MTRDGQPTSGGGPAASADAELLMAERVIPRVLHAYSRDVDRLALVAVDACDWPEGTDDHGDRRGGVDRFIDFLRAALARSDATNHSLGSVLVDADVETGVARSEAYAVAHHRCTRRDGRPAEMVAGLRHVDRFDRFERCVGGWRIAAQACAFDWWRNDPVAGDCSFGPGFVRGARSGDDIAYHILEAR